MWKFTTTKDTLRSRLGAVFDEFGDEVEHDEGQMAEEMHQVPVSMAIQQSIITVIKD